LGVKLVRRDVTSEEEIKKALEETFKGSVDAIFNTTSTLMRYSIDLLIKKAKLDRIPLSVNEDGLVDRGALISYGPDSRLVGLQAANLINKILKGAKPGEIKVEPPDRFFLAINQTTAKQIGLNIPRGVLEQADRLVQ
jgi:putative tryptophan/tyrosine transport system substrate-binding protein